MKDSSRSGGGWTGSQAARSREPPAEAWRQRAGRQDWRMELGQGGVFSVTAGGGGKGGRQTPGGSCTSSFTSWIPGRLPGRPWTSPRRACPSCSPGQPSGAGQAPRAAQGLLGGSGLWSWAGGRKARGRDGLRGGKPRTGPQDRAARVAGVLGENGQWLWPHPRCPHPTALPSLGLLTGWLPGPSVDKAGLPAGRAVIFQRDREDQSPDPGPVLGL